MKLAFVSNNLNHHQIHLCDALSRCCEEFRFIATEDVDGYGYQKTIAADYVVHWFAEEERAEAEKIICSFDAVIFGACPVSLIELRMRENKLSFSYTERIFKKGTWRRFIPTTRKKIYQRYLKYQKNDFYILSASSYLPTDLDLLGFPKKRCYRFGYFPEVKYYDDPEKVFAGKRPASILWVARWIPLKHPEDAIEAAKRLKQDGIGFTLEFVGAGPMEKKMRAMIDRYGLNNEVKLVGSLSLEKVRERMESAEILLFTSDQNEGWGAVVNEAMNSGCAVVVSDAVGSAAYLIRQGENGQIYHSGNVADLYEKTKFLLQHEAERKAISENAYRTITEQWNCNEAAERLARVAEALIAGEKPPDIPKGPLSTDEGEKRRAWRKK